MAEPGTDSNRRTLALTIGLALVGGLAAGAAVLYVTEGFQGNETLAASCPADTGLAAAIEERAVGEVAAVNALTEPFDVSGLAFKDADGAQTSLADFSGRTLLVNLWATWCAPCRAEMPALEALERQEGGADFAVVPINVDLGEPEKPRAFYQEIGLTALPFYRDETMGVFNDLKSQGSAFGLPVSLIVDGTGCARAIVNGPAEWASPDAVRLIEAVKDTGTGAGAAGA